MTIEQFNKLKNKKVSIHIYDLEEVLISHSLFMTKMEYRIVNIMV